MHVKLDKDIWYSDEVLCCVDSVLWVTILLYDIKFLPIR